LYGVLGYDLDLQRTSERPALLLPDFANFPALGIVERVTEGIFPSDVLAGVRALGQEVQGLAPYTETAFRGFAIGIGRDGRSGGLSGNLPPYFNGAGLGY
jgi:hypothetical protein